MIYQKERLNQINHYLKQGFYQVNNESRFNYLGNIFQLEKQYKDTFYWRCLIKNCKGRIHSLKNHSEIRLKRLCSNHG